MAFGLVEFPIDLTHEFLERVVIPLGIVLGSVGTVPGVKIVRWVKQG